MSAMPTDEERRKVAAEMRGYPAELTATLHPAEEALAYYVLDLMSIVGLEGEQVTDLFARLADLIEPEPERTCCNTSADVLKGPFTCSACDEYSETWIDIGFGDRMMEVPKFCPNCGAKVVEE